MRKTSMTKVAAAAMAAAMMLTACGGGNAATATTAAPAADNGAAATQTEAASTGATITDTDIVVAMGADIVTMDPANQNDTTSSVLMNHVYNTLMEVNDDGELVGDLAESYEIVDDGKAYIFHLYENACFSDGTPVTAEDVKFTYERAMESAKTKSDVEAVESIEVIDEHTVKMNLKMVYAPFITKTTDTGLCILSKAATEAAGDAYGDVDTVLGSGAFIPTEWVPNDHYTLVRNENYWKETPIATSIEVR
ncbi:MAG: ABC transporter substrate-binding protein, partial [Lachnospiraceae bacterium]|nr:ABC transporter substrate-binding protein [Lachnospiraceae bacterium]